ncbi:hypothetical protein [Aeoliella sp. SH292]|uniref:hypothetical protein n=1 Tax=Aeoliella sp. SH292 TaxID=3454464 RepID=UPI003F955FDB
MDRGIEDGWSRIAAWLAWLQGLYFVTFGIWPLVDMNSFQWVTGPKFDHLPNGNQADHWLVFTVGLQLAVIGLVLMLAAYRHDIGLGIALLGLLSAAALFVIDVVYVSRGIISAIYLMDAVIEIVIVGGWIAIIARYRMLTQQGRP